VLDGVVQSYPVIKDAKFDRNDVGSAAIQGAGAKDLALVLRYGPAVPLDGRRCRTCRQPGQGPAPGGIAAASSVSLVALYMLVYYRMLEHGDLGRPAARRCSAHTLTHGSDRRSAYPPLSG